MTLPSFLIIGAMKSGTTTLFRDLACHPHVFEPLDKEPGLLCTDQIRTAAGLTRYEDLFRRCRSDQITFEASTNYSKMPRWTGVASRARDILGGDLKIIYILRDPVARARSHHRHLMDAGQAGPDFNEEVKQNPDYIDFSRYAMQIEPWLDCFSESQIRIIRFETYMSDRIAMAVRLQKFLGLAEDPDVINPDAAANISDGKEVHTAMSRRLGQSSGYRRYIRPWLPSSMRQRLKNLVMTRSTSQADDISQETRSLIADRTAEDVKKISPLMDPPLATGELAWPITTAP